MVKIKVKFTSFCTYYLLHISTCISVYYLFSPKPAPDAAPAPPNTKAAPGSEQSQAALSSRHNVSFPCNISAKADM